MSEPSKDSELPSQNSQITGGQSSTIAKLLGKDRPKDPGPPVRQQSSRSTRTKALPKEAYQSVKRSIPKLDSEVDQLLSDADALTGTGKKGSANDKSKTSAYLGSKTQDSTRNANLVYMEGTMTLDALNAELATGDEATARLREMLIAANQRIAQLEGQIKRIKDRTSIRAGEDISLLLEQTNAAKSIAVADMLKPLAPEVPANWELAQEKLKDKCRQLIQTLKVEREQHDEVERTLKLENLGLTRRLKYAVLRTRELEGKLKSQEKYIKDCEAAILKQHKLTEHLRSRMMRTREPQSCMEKDSRSRSEKRTSSTPKTPNASKDSAASPIMEEKAQDSKSNTKKTSQDTVLRQRQFKKGDDSANLDSDSSFHLTPKKKLAESVDSFSDDFGYNLGANNINISELSDDFDI
ncbi:Hypothetical protein GLP15_3507 [Giardia lamblia P15]|uniref:Uncharacterized protein n=1 Tax=Giardia intestinalis (strain P15) TaxID=658858 RepID=E1EVQ0_GIAIA|nr:Hypothetical protein GLP15_3507 [Giardia lamblia P15]